MFEEDMAMLFHRSSEVALAERQYRNARTEYDDEWHTRIL